tara:strand:- start:85 stop:591 length:507 start_codon:yes stop_codon:yes gene_type:complete
MADISVEAIKALREETSAGIMDCKNALAESNGDLQKAAEILREKGLLTASKKSSRETSEGIIDCYIHTGGRVAAVVELNCETDFVARTTEFKDLAHNLAMQVAAMAPTYLDSESVPTSENVNPEESCLMEQSFIRDPSTTIRDLVNETVGKVGENIRVRRFQRFSLGE